jgi:hypothetical protein
MKNKFKILFAFIGLVMLFTACSPDEFKLGSVLDKSTLKFSIIPDAKDPNMIIIKSLTSGVTPQWITPLGRSIRVQDTVRIAFPGKYNFIYGVECAGGLVQADTFKITITTTNLSYVNDPLWTSLTGGVGKSKTWVPDNGKYGFAAGFMSYADPSVSQEFDNFTINWDPGNTQVKATDTDFKATMTFDLIGGPHLTVVKPNEPGAPTSGTYFFDAKNHTLSTNDVTVIRIAAIITEVSNWTGNVKVLKLNDNQLRIAFMRTDPSQGPWWDVYNYVSKDYASTYVGVEPEPTLPTGWQTGVSQTTSTTVKWVLSPNTPFNWANLDGSLMNTDWTSADKYASWTGFSATIASSYANFSLTMNSADHSVVYVDPSNKSTNGTYTLDDKGVYTFAGITPNFVISGGWVTLSTTADNQWRITKIEKDISGNISGMWVGKRDPAKAEYMVYHLIPQLGGTTEAKGTPVTFDNTKLLYGDLEKKGNLRLELYNTYGDSKANPPLTPTDVKFSNRLSVTFTLKGVVLKAGAVGTYKAAISFANPDWSVQYWGDGTGAGDLSVNGDGTYTVWFQPSAAVTEALIFLIDIKGIATDITDMTAVKATVDKILLY